MSLWATNITTGQSPSLVGKLTISMAIFHGYVRLPEGMYVYIYICLYLYLFTYRYVYCTLYDSASFQAEGFEWHREATDCDEAKDGKVICGPV